MSNITLTIPNDDHIALRAFGKALEEMALAHGAEPRKTTVGELSYKLNIDTSEATAALERLNTATDELMQAAPRMMDELRIDGTAEIHGKRKEPEVDTTSQQVESLATNVDLLGPTVSDATTDSTGTPWDERIHSTSKALNADGTWRLRRKPKDMDEAEWVVFVESVKTEISERTIDEYAESINDALTSHGERLDETAEGIQPPVTLFYAPENYVYMYRAADNIYGLAKSDAEVTEFEADGYVRHTQEQYDAWEGPNTADEGDDHHTDADVVTEQTVAGIPPLPVPPPVPEVTAWDFPRLMTFLTERHGKIDVATVNTLLAQDGLASLQELNAHPDKIGPFVARVKAHLGE